MKRIPLLLAAVLLLAACTLRPEPPDPHEGMIQVNDGTGLVWLPLVEELELNALLPEDFSSENGVVSYAGGFRRGIDVSEHQLEIDWAAVAQSGMADFAFIRAGYRGYTEGQMYEDAWYRRNMEGAAENGIDTGVYFFSQAITPEEAEEEARFLLELIEGYDISCPVVYDWEPMHMAEARTEGLSDETLTDCALAFCKVIEEAGYEPMVYVYRHLAYHNYDLGRLADYDLWVGAPGETPDFAYAHSWWQYSYTGSVPGIQGDVDLNLHFPELPQSGSNGENAE
ncbi:MAG: glycoside hydrolase family 25 protein [Candidatus Heteroscillospira sp.]